MSGIAANQNMADESRSRRFNQLIIIYVSLVCLTMLAIGMGIAFIPDLKDKIYIFGPAFLIIVLVMFYGLVLQPKPFTPTKIRRYAKRPPAVEELSRLLRSPTPAPAGEKMYRVWRSVLCHKLDLEPGAPDEEIMRVAEGRHPELAGDIGKSLESYRYHTDGRKMMLTESEFVEEYNALIKLLYSIDNRIWK